MQTLQIGAFAFLLALSTAAQSDAQASPTLAPKTKVRLTVAASGDKWVGTLVSMSGDSVRISVARTKERVVRISELARFDTAAGQRRHFATGLLIGFGAGALAAALDPCEGSCFVGPAEAIMITGLAGGFVGGILGFLAVTDRWAPVELAEGARAMLVSAAPTPYGLRLTTTIRF